MFASLAWGDVRRTLGRHGYYAYFPKPLPRHLELDSKTILLQSQADLALGRLAGAARLLPNTAILITPYSMQEALDSSRIEGTQASLSELFNATATGETTRMDVAEVLNYMNAMEHGLSRLRTTLPLSLRLMKEMHQILLTGVRGQEKTPGEFRTSQNWIGSPDGSIDRARFVPPPVDAMTECLRDWESYQHEEVVIPLLVRCGLLHYQFETIHPFLDGNGRLGRLFITLFLVESGPLPAPILYLSSYFENNKPEYYNRLQAVRETGDIRGWLQFFLRAVALQAENAVVRAETLMDLRERYRQQVLAATRSRAAEVVDVMLENPLLTAKFVAQRLKTTQQTGLNVLRQLESIGILRELAPSQSGRIRWAADEILRAVYDTTQFEVSG